MIFETHSHYDDEAFIGDRDEILRKCHASGIEIIVNIGVNKETAVNTIRLTEDYPFVYGVIGVHPSDSTEFNEEEYEWIKDNCINTPKILGIGEIGLDYHWDDVGRDIQMHAFREQLRLAEEISMPVVIHSRDAAKDTMDTLKQYDKVPSGVIHCYSYHLKDALDYIEMGYYIGIGGVVTYKNASKIKEVVENIPIERIVLETDCPYLTPHPFRGKRNCSLYLPYVVEKIAELKGLTAEEVEEITYRNAVKMFRMEA
ncbi:MAG: TatD family hydrolase [Lachnospiraceae bacterium]|nr:TatD family hydrolase [Lachnospiraceae bacterium]